jgi:calcium-binding protein CML
VLVFEWNKTGKGMEKSDASSTEGILRLFRRFDTNGDGLIDESEFGEILKTLGWDSSSEVRALEFAVIDRNSDGLVDFREFADWWRDHN